MSNARRHSPKSVPFVYGALTAALVMVIATVAVVVKATSTPAIAEFGPSAQDQIQDSRSDQGRSGTDGGRDGAARACPPLQPGCDPEALAGEEDVTGSSTTTTTTPIEVPAGRRCYGNPPRQTEDPHSPPCKFEIFRGDNGGVTATGVTGSEIKVAFPITSSGDKAQMDTINSLVNHFNRRYEFYGRRITPVFVGRWPFDSAAENEATAQDLVNTGAFAVASPTLYWNSNAMIHRRLAQNDIISVVGQQTAFASTDMVEGRTFTVDPPMDHRLRTAGRLACRTLKGRNAVHAGDAFRGRERKFAIVQLTESAGGPDVGPLADTLKACGIEVEKFDLSFWALYPDYTTLMNRLSSGGYTTVIPVAPALNMDLMSGATRAGYYPEWFIPGTAAGHLEYVWGGPGQSQTVGHAEHAFGITAEFSIRPGVGDVTAVAAWREGGGAGNVAPEQWYDPLLVIAAGIQGAGPDLTPDNFANALRSMRFPNPNAGAPPYWQPGVGFGRGDSAFRNDYAVWWWSDDAPAQQTVLGDDGRGSFCYIERGARFTAETFPADSDAKLRNTSVPCK